MVCWKDAYNNIEKKYYLFKIFKTNKFFLNKLLKYIYFNLITKSIVHFYI